MDFFNLIDISSEDDLLIPSSSREIGSETFSNLEVENIERVCKQMEQLSESPQQKCRSDRYNLRKSLAWDSEFFTSEGVLNPEELAIYNSTYSKANGLKLIGIHEELRKSAESISTLDSENRALENSEVHLFENLRVSSKRMLMASNQAVNMKHSGKAKEQRKPDSPHLRSLNKIDFSSQTKVASGNGQSRTSNKPPKISSTVVNKQIKSDRGKVLPGITAKRQTSLALDKVTTDPVIVSRSIPSKEFVFKSVSASCSSSIRPPTSLSGSSSSRHTIIRNSAKNTICSSSSFSSKTSSKATRNRTGSTNQICSSSLGNSTVRLPKVSPSSSIDSFVSESSSQTSTSTNHSNSLKGSIRGSASFSSTTVSTGNDTSQRSGGALSQSFTGNHSKKFDSDTKGTASLGLRMPRPRVGYFDKEKNQLQGSNKYLQTTLSSSMAKSNGISGTSAANRSKLINPYSTNHPSKSESSTKTAGNNRKNLEKKIEEELPHPNLLQPKFVVMGSEINGCGEQMISDQAMFTNTLSDAEKENLLPPESKTEGNCKDVTILEGMLSCLSLSEMKDLTSRD